MCVAALRTTAGLRAAGRLPTGTSSQRPGWGGHRGLRPASPPSGATGAADATDVPYRSRRFRQLDDDPAGWMDAYLPSCRKSPILSDLADVDLGFVSIASDNCCH